MLLFLQRQQVMKLLHLLLFLVKGRPQQADLPVGGGGFELYLLDEPHLGAHTHSQGSGHHLAAPRRNVPSTEESSDSVHFQTLRHHDTVAEKPQRWRPTGIADSRASPTQKVRKRDATGAWGPLEVASPEHKPIALGVPPILMLLCGCRRPSLRKNPTGHISYQRNYFCTEPNTFCVYRVTTQFQDRSCGCVCVCVRATDP